MSKEGNALGFVFAMDEARDKRNKAKDARIAELEAVIAKLDKTEDGVPILVGETYFAGGEDEAWVITAIGLDHYNNRCLWGRMSYKGGTFTGEERLRQGVPLYSTQEAAKAIKEQDND